MDPEWIHIGLMIGQYVLLPVGLWAAKRFKQSIIKELKAHEDARMEELFKRVSRIEDVLMSRGVRRAASGRRDGKGRFVRTNA